MVNTRSKSKKKRSTSAPAPAPAVTSPVPVPAAPIVPVPVPLPGTMAAATDRYLDHVLSLVGFDRARNPDHPVFLALAARGCTTFYDLFYLNDNEVKGLSYVDATATPPFPVPLPRGNQQALLTPIAYHRYHEATTGDRLSPDDWLSIQVPTINEFILGPHRDAYLPGAIGYTAPTVAPPQSSSSKSRATV